MYALKRAGKKKGLPLCVLVVVKQPLLRRDAAKAPADLATGLCPVASRQIIFRLHFQQPTFGAIKFKPQLFVPDTIH